MTGFDFATIKSEYLSSDFKIMEARIGYLKIYSQQRKRWFVINKGNGKYYLLTWLTDTPLTGSEIPIMQSRDPLHLLKLIGGPG